MNMIHVNVMSCLYSEGGLSISNLKSTGYYLMYSISNQGDDVKWSLYRIQHNINTQMLQHLVNAKMLSVISALTK